MHYLYRINHLQCDAEVQNTSCFGSISNSTASTSH